MSLPLSCSELRTRIAQIPRVSLGHFPTPLEFCPRLSETIGGPRIFIKRDDCTGLAFGGNKTRLLEFTIGQALYQGADVLIGGAGSHSNHCRQLAAAAAHLGVDCALVLCKDHKSNLVQGNLLLHKLLGATVDLIEVDSPEFLTEAKEELKVKLRREGRNPFVVMHKDVRHFGAMGYILCMTEIADQLENIGEHIDTLVVCSGSSTQPGIIFGNKVLGIGLRVIGITPIDWTYNIKKTFLELLAQLAETLKIEVSFSPEETTNLRNYIGAKGYGYCTPEGNEALRLMAQSEGILLDPIYSAKALAGLIDLSRSKKLKKSESVLFLHTGGTPALFSYSEELGGLTC